MKDKNITNLLGEEGGEGGEERQAKTHIPTSLRRDILGVREYNNKYMLFYFFAVGGEGGGGGGVREVIKMNATNNNKKSTISLVRWSVKLSVYSNRFLSRCGIHNIFLLLTCSFP